MLKETSGLDRNASWSSTKKRLDSDPRYKAVESSSRREDWFRDYIRTLGDRPTTGSGGAGSEGEEDTDAAAAAAEERKQREKEKRIEESIRKREEEVSKTL
jgi:transcription elongation regulator 1